MTVSIYNMLCFCKESMFFLQKLKIILISFKSKAHSIEFLLLLFEVLNKNAIFLSKKKINESFVKQKCLKLFGIFQLEVVKNLHWFMKKHTENSLWCHPNLVYIDHELQDITNLKTSMVIKLIIQTQCFTSQKLREHRNSCKVTKIPPVRI